jgi:hypothetical protein
MSDSLRLLFDSFRSEADLRALIPERREESLYLEFKEKADAGHNLLEEPDRKNFSKALSAFANGAGGVLVFGVEATKVSADAPDRATALRPISSADGFMAKLKDLLLATTQPVVDDVEFRLLPSDGDPRAGYVMCLIPQSDKPPHRAMHAGREYYRRTDNGCRRLEHLDLEDMFGRRPRPLLFLGVELRPRPGDDPHEELDLVFRNEGRAVAHYAGLLGTLLDSAAVVRGGQGGVINATAFNGGAPCFQYIDNTSVVHPNGIGSFVGHAIIQRPRKGEPLKLRLQWYCDGMRARASEVEIAPGQQYVVK